MQTFIIKLSGKWGKPGVEIHVYRSQWTTTMWGALQSFERALGMYLNDYDSVEVSRVNSFHQKGKEY